MPWELTTDPSLRLVQLRYEGEIRFEERVRARDAVFARCFDTGFARALVDMRASDIRLTEGEAVKFASVFQTARLPPNYRLACVVAEDRKSEKLVEIVISLEGVNVRYFCDPAAALAWLTAF